TATFWCAGSESRTVGSDPGGNCFTLTRTGIERTIRSVCWDQKRDPGDRGLHDVIRRVGHALYSPYTKPMWRRQHSKDRRTLMKNTRMELFGCSIVVTLGCMLLPTF